MEKIVDIELDFLKSRIEAMGYGFTVTPEAKLFLADKGYSTKFGARPLKRAIQNHVEDRLAEIMIDDKLKQGDMLTISVENDETIVKIN